MDAFLRCVYRGNPLNHLLRLNRDHMGRNKNADKIKLEERRARVAKLLTSRISQTEIARREGVPISTINRDVKAIRAAWREETMTSIDELVTQELAELAEIESQAAIEFVKSPPGKRSVKWLNLRLSAKATRMKLLGLDDMHAAAAAARAHAAAKAAVGAMTKEVEAMTPEELEAEYRATVLH